jgi:hypothetical protein
MPPRRSSSAAAAAQQQRSSSSRYSPAAATAAVRLVHSLAALASPSCTCPAPQRATARWAGTWWMLARCSRPGASLGPPACPGPPSWALTSAPPGRAPLQHALLDRLCGAGVSCGDGGRMGCEGPSRLVIAFSHAAWRVMQQYHSCVGMPLFLCGTWPLPCGVCCHAVRYICPSPLLVPPHSSS